MKKALLCLTLFLHFQTFAQSLNETKSNFQFNLIVGNPSLNLDNIIDKIKSVGYSDGQLNKANLSFGGGFEINVNKFQFGVDILMQDKTKQSFKSPDKSLEIFTTTVSPKLGRRFWLSKNLKLGLSAGPYFQNVSLTLKPTPNSTNTPATLVDFLVNPTLNLKEYSISSNLGGIDTQLKLNYFFAPKKSKYKENTVDGLSVFIALGYRNQFINNSKWKFSVSKNNNSSNSNTPNSSNIESIKFPNNHDFETSGLMFSLGLSFHTSYLGSKSQNKNLTSILYSK